MDNKNLKDNINFLKEYIEKDISLSILIYNLLNNLCECEYIKKDTLEDFIRFIYKLDEEWLINTQILKLLGEILYPFIKSNENFKEILKIYLNHLTQNNEIIYIFEKISEEIEKIGVEKLAEKIIEEEKIEIKIKEEKEKKEEEIEFETMEEKIGVYTYKTPLEKVKDFFYSLPFKIWEILKFLFLKFIYYVIPKFYELSKKYIKIFYIWLKIKLQITLKWVRSKVKRFIRWLKYEQEIYVPLRNYQKNKLGYFVIKKKKIKKIKINSKISKAIKSIYKNDEKEMLRIIKGILKTSLLEKEDREILDKIKNNIIINEKILTEKPTLLDIINYGRVKFLRILKKVSNLSNSRKFNKKIELYYFKILQPHIENLGQIFRKELENCKNYKELKKYLSLYPIYRESLIKNYKELKIIIKVKNIIKDFENRPFELTKILNKHLTPYGEANIRKKLENILIEAPLTEEIWIELKDENGILNILNKLKTLQKKYSFASSLVILIETFLNNKNSSFVNFKASLNFVPPNIQNKILYAMRDFLRKELKEKIEELINIKNKNPKDYIKNYKLILDILKNDRYRDKFINIYGYSISEIEEKLTSIPENIEKEKLINLLHHKFSNSKVPSTFFEFVVKVWEYKNKIN